MRVVAEQRVVIEGDLRVERQPFAFAGENQRIDLGERSVFGDIGLEQRLRDRRETIDLLGGNTELEAKLAGLVRMKAEIGIGIDADDLFGAVGSDLFDIDATLGACHDQNLTVGAIENDPEIELARDIDAGGDQDLVNLMTANVHAKNGISSRFRIRRSFRELDAAGFAASTGVNLGLNRDELTESGSGRFGFLRSLG